MPPKRPNTTIFAVLILLVLLIIVVMVTVFYQRNNNQTTNTPATPAISQYPMTIVKPKNNQIVTATTNVEARVKAPLKTQDLSSTVSVDGQVNQNLKVRKTPAGDIFLAGTLTNLSPGSHSIGINLYSLSGSSKQLVSNAQYQIIVQ